MEKLHSYQGLAGRCHEIRDAMRDKLVNWRGKNPDGVIGLAKNTICRLSGSGRQDPDDHGFSEGSNGDFSHVYR